jgi:hypothetical protein
VGGDLRGGRTLSILTGQVCLNLLTARAGGVKVLARVAADLGLPAATALDLIIQVTDTLFGAENVASQPARCSIVVTVSPRAFFVSRAV